MEVLPIPATKVLGEPMQVVKDFTGILAGGEKSVCIRLRERKGQMHRAGLALKIGGLSLLSLGGQGAGRRGTCMSILVPSRL